MTIEELLNQGKINPRTYNICFYNDLLDSSSIYNHYKIYRSFLNFRNCGVKTENELISICVEHEKNIQSDISSFNNLKEIYEKHFGEYQPDEFSPNFETKESKIELTTIQSNIINDYIVIEFQKLSVRSKNALDLYLNHNFSYENYDKKIFSNKCFNANYLVNVGEKSVNEISEFLNGIRENIIQISKISNQDLKLNSIKQKLIINLPKVLIPHEILGSESIFLLANYLINNNLIFTDKRDLVFRDSFKIFKNQKTYNLQDIALKCNLTRERVRQIRKKMSKQLFEKLSSIKILNDDLYNKYEIDTSSDIIYLDDNLFELINKQNQTWFSNEFITYLMFIYLSENYELIGEIEDVLINKDFISRERYNWKRLYIVKKEITINFDFIGLVNSIENVIKSRIGKEFKVYLYNFLKPFSLNEEILLYALPTIEKLIISEFGLTIDLDGYLIFEKNTVKQVHEYVIEVLEFLNTPSKISKIFSILNEKFPGFTKSTESLRGSIQRCDEIIYFGRSSTYGLKKWESENNGIKGGTIKNLALDFLMQNDNPVHILELLDEIHKYRGKTTVNNLRTNLSLDPLKQFIFFNQGFVGLKSKKYSNNLVNLPKFLGKTIISWISKNKSLTRKDVELHFSKVLNISEMNVNYILRSLFEQGFINI